MARVASIETMFEQLRKLLPGERRYRSPAPSVGGLFAGYMVLLYLVVGLGPVVLVQYAGHSVSQALRLTVLLVGGAYFAGMALVFRYF